MKRWMNIFSDSPACKPQNQAEGFMRPIRVEHGGMIDLDKHLDADWEAIAKGDHE
jgi:hypothetical protein